MKITYDPEVDILMVHLEDRAAERRARGQQIEGAYLDLAEDGTVLAIEVQDASKRYPTRALAKHQAEHKPLSITEAARLAGLTPVALRKAAERGTLKATRIGERWAVDLDDLRTYLETHGRKPAAVAEPAAGARGPVVQERVRRGAPGSTAAKRKPAAR